MYYLQATQQHLVVIANSADGLPVADPDYGSSNPSGAKGLRNGLEGLWRAFKSWLRAICRPVGALRKAEIGL